MSELINNKAKRVEMMKELMHKLHKGTSESQVKEELENLLDQADYSDVFAMEAQLIEEGISQEAIQSLCDSHTNVLRKHLDNQESPKTIPGHPVHTFLEENKAVLGKILEIQLICKTIQNKTQEVEVIGQVKKIQGFLNELMDIDKHYRKKENLLFPYFEKKKINGPPTVMWGKHDETRELLKTTISGLQEITSIQTSEAKAFIEFAINPSLESLKEMTYKEEKILFPFALDLLTEQEWYEIYIQSDEIGYCLIDPKEEWKPKGGHNIFKNDNLKEGRVQLPTGSFKVEELENIFSIMPFDITFVDKDDCVRYFSLGKERIFDRNRAILGRKVQYCHPPSSVHIVDRILDDFKTGKEDEAKFWINFKSKFIHIAYYAVRDKNRNYLGTIEVSQDITELREIQGERRILE